MVFAVLAAACSKLTSPPGPDPIASDTPLTAASASAPHTVMTAPQNAKPTPPPTGAQGEVKIEDIVVGRGVETKMGDTVTMHYTGTLLDGSKFDSSHDHEGNKPLISVIPNPRLIQGWNRGIPGMKVGGKRRLTIPPALGYGGEAKAKIPANSTLVFELELVDSKPTPQRPMPQHP